MANRNPAENAVGLALRQRKSERTVGFARSDPNSLARLFSYRGQVTHARLSSFSRRSFGVIAVCRNSAIIIGRCRSFFTYERQPVARRRVLTFGDFEKQLLNLLGDLATAPVTNRYAINRTDRRNFSGGSREEQLVGNVKCRALNTSL